MKILILSFYYHPDLSAGSFRCAALVEELKKEIPDAAIDIITTFPNRYSSFTPNVFAYEKNDNCCIQRIKLPLHRNGILDQSQAFYHYAKNVVRITKKEKYDLIFATSSRLMTAALGAFISKKKNVSLYLDIRDLFVDTLFNIMPKHKAYITKPIFTQIEKWTFKQACRINLVSKGFQSYVESSYKEKSLRYFTNGIDEEFIDHFTEEGCLSGIKRSFNNSTDNLNNRRITIVYAGNIGEGQGLHLIIPKLANYFKKDIIFKIIGDGGRINQLKEEIIRLKCCNIELIPPVNRKNLLKYYLEADILFLHLNKYEAFKKVLPSKLFEYAALGKPILAGLSGYASDFASKELSNIAIFRPCDVNHAIEQFGLLNLEQQYNADFISKYRRKNIMNYMAKDINDLLQQTMNSNYFF